MACDPACPGENAEKKLKEIHQNSKFMLSNYAEKLEGKVKQRYLEKISEVGVDPLLIPDHKLDPECLPPIEASDLLSYLGLDTSYYTNKQFKAFKSLQAYNQMVSGFICSIQGTVLQKKHVVVAKVRHSQRMNLSHFGLLPTKMDQFRVHTVLDAWQVWENVAPILPVLCFTKNFGQELMENSVAHR